MLKSQPIYERDSMNIDQVLNNFEQFTPNKHDLVFDISEKRIDIRLQLGFALLNESIYGSSRTNQDRLGQSSY